MSVRDINDTWEWVLANSADAVADEIYFLQNKVAALQTTMREMLAQIASNNAQNFAPCWWCGKSKFAHAPDCLGERADKLSR
jgi:hypothetical protein